MRRKLGLIPSRKMGKYFVLLALCAAWACKLSTTSGLVDPYNNAIEVTDFVAVPISDTAVSLSWKIPAGSSPNAIRILRKTGSYPNSKSDGTVVFDSLGTSTIDSGLATNVRYYYTAYAYAWLGYVPAGVNATAYPNNQLPTVISSTPADTAMGVAPCSGNPCRAKIILQFSESMNPSLAQTLTTDIWNGAAYVAAPIAITSTAWSTTLDYNDTLTLSVSWLWFAENSQIRYTIPAANLQDSLNNAMATQVQRSFTTTIAKQSFVLVDAGILTCYDDTVLQTCPFASHPGQDGDFVNIPSARSFTGPTAHTTYATNYTTTDNVTGLVWVSCSEGLSGATCLTGSASTYTWYNALSQCSALNSVNSGNGYAGHTTWRLPTQRELETLPNFNSSPAINTANFPATIGGNFWSSSTYVVSAANAWYVNFGGGSANSAIKTTSNYVRCVATGASITPITYTDNGDGTVTDATTALRWQKCPRGQNNDATCSGGATTATWQIALQYCDTLTLGSFANASNWRLPNYNELMSLIDKSLSSPAIKATSFPATFPSNYWSSSSLIGSPTSAFPVDFTNGTVISSAKTNPHYVRCVATGP